jgi:hypothetical protein
MSNYPNVVLKTRMFSEAQLDVPTSNPRQIKKNTLPSKLEGKTLKINPTYTSKRGRGL